ncbi:MoxR family ATPase [Virgibacillus halodenitrificans]|uniref:AAA family ATPase n=1 Tax=Virgibacillus halodenitrificans TaxID=1482 RepID=UPI001F3022F6|nr:MoxR family ATPase [Virgibacillus halodenitrificans]MCG1027342.1 MoxR family ATPase [Virgibacillus halodenitrificans]MEC2159156.1 MoxR family ATPase [Virgibacillus halodenitrificans]
MEALHKIKKAKEALNNVILGQEEAVDLVFITLLSGGHILLESVPGSGKTKLANALAKLIKGNFRRIQFTPDVLPSDVTGIQFFNPKTQEFEMRMGPVDTNILLADEINRATPRTQSSLLEVMEENQTTIDGETIQLTPPFFVIASQNPIESNQGTFPLPEAQLDRFMMMVKMDYPSYNNEKQILKNQRLTDPINDLSPHVTKEDIITLQKDVRKIEITDIVMDYLLELVRKTREHEDIEIGVSTRAALALMRASQSKALLEGKDYVTPQDIKLLAPHLFEHRINLSMEGSLRYNKEDIIQQLIESVPVPVEMGHMK